MSDVPLVKRTVAFVDGQNPYYAAREAFGHSYPNYDVGALSRQVCAAKGWALKEVRFYTGVPVARHDPVWHGFWNRKLTAMRRQGVVVYTRPLQYRTVTLSNGNQHQVKVEKGIDVRVALDVIRLANRRSYDVALVMSQDQDLTEVADAIRTIAREQARWIKIASAFPHSQSSRNPRGINRTDWVPIDQALYDRCLDPRDYRRAP